jgi:ABC-type sugar transport system permease subunit
VTLPILKPIFLILTSLSIIWDFGVFTQPYLLIGSSAVDTSNYLMASTSSSRATRTPTSAAARDLVADAPHRRRAERLLRPADGEDGRAS